MGIHVQSEMSQKGPRLEFQEGRVGPDGLGAEMNDLLPQGG